MSEQEEEMGRDLVAEIQTERRARHDAGHHEWQPGPLVPGPGEIPYYTMALVCHCGAVGRTRIPRIDEPPLNEMPVPTR